MTNEENCRVFSVFRPKSGTPLDYYIAKFDANSSVDFKNCTARMERENNFKEFKSMYGTNTDMPTSGAGSEYGREKREEARRKKFGFKARQYDPKSQPFILKIGAGKDVKNMKGTKNGGVTNNAGYVAFVMTQKNVISLPVSDWYNFAPVSKRVTLSIEEAEEQFKKNDKIYNHFAIMTDKKKDKIEDDDDDDDDFEGKPAKRRKRNSFDDNIETLSDSDEKLDSDDDTHDRKDKKRKRNEKSEDDETVEVGDDEGVDEGKELDYLSDDEEPLDEDVDEFNNFGQDDDEEQLADDKSDDDDEEDSDGEGEKKDGGDSDSDEDVDDLPIEPSGVKENTVKDNTPVNGKRKSDGPESASKKPKLEAHPVSSAIENMEDFIRDCLKEPISTSELMMKVSSQFSASLPKKELQQRLILIMKKLNPKSKNIEGAKHFFL